LIEYKNYAGYVAKYARNNPQRLDISPAVTALLAFRRAIGARLAVADA
jgi:hypothetical protein